ncbi:UDP-N-acetylmuramate--L-alanine ligase [Oscillatoria amoena NRMC-F 0135]|nr:UDP-N-acetylmuramate--L-alanine ligase [Oscillatoria amoena NRMC-F 0135]
MNQDVITQICGSGSGRVHLIGVAGSGMSGLARLLLQKGCTVSGSDLSKSEIVERLKAMGLHFCEGHQADNIRGAALVVYSSAIRPDNAEYAAALAAGIPVMRRAEALSAIVSGREFIAVTGMHGKTTTTSMLAYVLRACHQEPGHYVGAEVPDLGASADWGSGARFAAEIDESDGSITVFEPDYSIVLNIEEEHLDHYRDIRAILAAFEKLGDKTRRKIFYCADDPETFLLFAKNPKAVSFGFGGVASLRAIDIQLGQFSSTYQALSRDRVLGSVTLNVPGRQNVSNSLAVIAVALETGLDFGKVAKALGEFCGARRRFEVRLKTEEFIVVDDYAHHPTEIKATLAAAKSGNSQRIIALFQPHRYSRTLHFKDEFAKAFDDADLLFLTDIYAASEKPVDGVTGQTICDAVRQSSSVQVEYEPDFRKLHSKVSGLAQPGDMIITLGAGNIHKVASRIAEELKVYGDLRARVKETTKILRQEPMRKHTTMHVGGPAQFWIEPADEGDLKSVLEYAAAKDIPRIVVGRGSNLLVREGGIRGFVLHLGSPHFKRVEMLPGNRILVGAGARNKEVVMQLKRMNLGGFEYLAGIPGNIGGALRMNAGAMGGSTFDVVESVRFMDDQGVIYDKKKEELEVYYRDVPVFKTHIALSAVLKASSDEPQKIAERLKAMDTKRWTSQPAAPSAGCIFKNPGMCGAGQLIDELSLKNTRVGGVRVSDIHGNFIINDQKGTADDVLELIEIIKKKAREAKGIELETEVMILGEEGHREDYE